MKVFHDAYLKRDYHQANRVFNFIPSDKRIQHIKTKLESSYLEPLRRYENLKAAVNRSLETKDYEEVRRLLEKEGNYKDAIVEGLDYARNAQEKLRSEKTVIDGIMRLLKKHGEEVEGMNLSTSFLTDTAAFLNLETTRQKEKKEKIVSVMLDFSEMFSKSPICFVLNMWYNLVEQIFNLLSSYTSQQIVALLDQVENHKEINLETLEEGSFRKWSM